MRRRDFIEGLCASATWLTAARADSATPVVGFLDPGSSETFKHFRAAFGEGLNAMGYVEGRNVSVEYHGLEGQYDRAPIAAAALVAHQVSVIVATSLPIALAAKAATTTIPIVFATGDDPVKSGLVAGLNRPGGNMTGVTFLSPAIEAKRVELLHELAPRASTIAVLINPTFPAAEVRASAVRGAAEALGLQLTVYNAAAKADIEKAFEVITTTDTGALLVTTDPLFFIHHERLVELAAHHALPAAYFTREFVEAGGLMSYGSSILEAYRQAGVYTGQILKGTKPVELPVQQPTKFELVINNKTVKALGLTVPQTLLVAADEVIE
jgi:putative tryptophan/tyrosine transport system substrate-binding protein